MIDKSMNTFEKGLYQDTANVNQPQGTYTFALNALKEFSETNPGVLQNEYGFLKDVEFPIGTILLGQVELEDNSACIFTLSQATNEHKISIYKLDGTITDIFSNSNLNFQAEHQIQATYKINSLGQRIVYFTDNFNPIRTLNLDIALLDPTFYDEVDDLTLFPTTTPFQFESTLLNTGGSLQTGGYRFFARLVKTGQSNSQYTYPSKVIYVTFGNTESNFDINTGLLTGPENHGNTTSSIRLDFTNLDPDYDSIQVGYTLTQDGVSSTKLITNTYTYSTTTTTITITGSESTSAIEESETTVSNIIYNTAKTITQKDNRLLLGNVSIEQESENLQQYVNNIIVTWITESETIGQAITGPLPDLTAFDLSHQYHASIPKQYKKSFMRDEVYSLGISFLMDSGNETKVYHIPGRVAISSDTTPITDMSSKNADPTGSGGINMPKWKVYNTATAVTSSSGTMGYWESTLNYPSDPNLGFPSGPIRHHKMPDTSVSSPFSVGVTTGVYSDIIRNNLGIQINNINLPSNVAEKVVGYRIWVQDRSSFNDRSIIAKGLIYNAVTSKFQNKKQIVHPHPCNNILGNPLWNRHPAVFPTGSPTTNTRTDELTPYMFFDSPDTQLYQPPLGTILNTERRVEGYMNYGDIAVGILANESGNPDFRIDDPVLKYMCDNVQQGYIYKGTTNHPLSETVRRLKHSKYIGYNTIDTTLAGFTGIDKIDNQKRNFTTVVQVVDDNVTANLNWLSRTEDSTCAPGGFFWTAPGEGENYLSYKVNNNNTMEVRYGSIKNELPQQYGDVLNKVYKTDGKLILGLSTSNWFIGDTFVDTFQYKQNLFLTTPAKSNTTPTSETINNPKNYTATSPSIFLPELNGTGGKPFIVGCAINTCVTESYVNHRYRSNSTEEVPDSIQVPPTDSQIQAEKRFWPRDVYSTNSRDWLRLHAVFPNYLVLKSEYSQIYSSKINIGFTTSDLLNLNADNKGRYATRVAYSQSDAQEALVDPYRIFLTNNYRDLPRNKGQLWNLFVNSNTLFGACENTLWSIFTSEQALTTSKDTIVIGTGEFLGIPPREMLTIDTGYAGTRSQWSFTQSPYGILFVDDVRGKIFLFSDKLEEISLFGSYQYFYENGPLKLKDTIPNFTNTDNPANPRGIGYTSSYDNKYKRFIITKRDYRFIGDDENASFSDPSQYENRSFTLSYYPTSKQWVSYHSYIPTNQFSIKQETILKDSLQTDINSQAFHIMNKGETIGKYFNNDIKPFIIDMIINKDAPFIKVYDSLYVNTLVETPNNREASKLINTFDIFFDEVVFYNNTQCTGEYNLIVNDNVKRKEHNWYLQVPRDLVDSINEQTFVNEWNFTQNLYPIDKVVNINKLDFAKPWYEQARIRDYYMGTRFKYNNLDNKKFLCNFVSSTYRISYR